MIVAAPALCLPLLHPETGEHGPFLPAMTGVRHLWPGLPNMPEGYWTPPSLPFSPQEALTCLRDLQAMSEAALTGTPVHALIGSEPAGKSLARLEEEAALTHFAATGLTAEQPAARKKEESSAEAPTDSIYVRRAAHKALLWAWLLEERHREVRALTQCWSKDAGQMLDSLGVEPEEAWLGITHDQSLLPQGDIPLPAWRMVLENAALFLPEDCLLLVNHPDMAESIRHMASPVPLASQTLARLGLGSADNKPERASQACLPLHQLCGHDKAGTRPWLQKNALFVLWEA